MPLLMFVICLVVSLFNPMARGAEEGPPPNVVLIVSDDQGWGDYSFMGHPQIETPRIDRLAAESLAFTRGYVPCSLCRPSLASLVTGRYPHEHRIVGNDPRLPPELASLKPRERLSDSRYIELRRKYSENLDAFPMLPSLLALDGYFTDQAGKWWELDYKHAGFTHGMTHGDPRKAGRHGDVGLEIGRRTMQPVLEFLDLVKKDEKPFFMLYAPMMPHTPHNPPERLLEKYKSRTPHLPQAKYWAMCEWFDETVGQVLDALDERKLSDNTIVIYLADNGWTQPLDQEPRAFGAPRGKRSPYDGGLRTSMLIRWPGHVQPRRDDTRLVTSLDILPTVLTAAGVESPAALPGINLLDDAAVDARHAVYGETYDHDATFPTKPAETLQYRWVVSGEWKLIVPQPRVEQGVVELFHITADPNEQDNLAKKEPQRVAELQSLLDAFWTPPEIAEVEEETAP